MPEKEPTFWLIAGPNGVGKTTYAFKSLEALTGTFNFINMDEIARGISPLKPSAFERDAARIALARARTMIATRQTFAMETTMSGQTHMGLIGAAKSNGMRTSLMYFSVENENICMERVARRVAEGGHNVAPSIIKRRFNRSHANLQCYTAICDLWRIYEASGNKPCLALEGQRTELKHRDDACLANGNAMLTRFANRMN
ncbi:MAG: AAA family ATPase [Pseudomonadota bacterium]